MKKKNHQPHLLIRCRKQTGADGKATDKSDCGSSGPGSPNTDKTSLIAQKTSLESTTFSDKDDKVSAVQWLYIVLQDIRLKVRTYIYAATGQFMFILTKKSQRV